jgi:CIC family chloride channel protein
MEKPLSLDVLPAEDLSLIHKHHLLLASGIGLGVGGVAVGFEWASSFVSHIQGYVTSSFARGGGSFVVGVLFCALAGGLVGALTQWIAPEAGGSGIPHVKSVLAHLQSLRGFRVMLVKFFGGALVIGSKFSLGREGPTVHIGASLADEVAKRAKIPNHLRDHLIACGAGAGLAAAFNAPLAGFLFVIEELRREVSSITLGMALLGTVLADAVVQFTFGGRPVLQVSDISVPALQTIPAILLIAIVATSGGLLFNKALVLGVTKVPSRFPLWARGIVVGCGVGMCITFAPSLVLDEQGVFELFSRGPSLVELSSTMLGVLFLGKLLLTVACYATGVPGGIFAPMLVQGAILGFMTAKFVALTPFTPPTLEVSALLGMTAFFAASVRAPFTGVVLLAEMTNGFELLLPLMVAALIGYFVAELLGTKPIYERLLAISREDERCAAPLL